MAEISTEINLKNNPKSTADSGDFSEDLLFKCECGNFEYFEFSRFEEEYFIALVGEPPGLWYRIIKAVKYIWGKKLYYHEIVITKEQAMLLQNAILKGNLKIAGKKFSDGVQKAMEGSGIGIKER